MSTFSKKDDVDLDQWQNLYFCHGFCLVNQWLLFWTQAHSEKIIKSSIHVIMNFVSLTVRVIKNPSSIIQVQFCIDQRYIMP